MKCIAKGCDGQLKVTNTYSGGERGKAQRRQCEKCGLVVVTQTLILHVDPQHGQGAAAVARRMRDEREG
jgi:hypothetical protein